MYLDSEYYFKPLVFPYLNNQISIVYREGLIFICVNFVINFYRILRNKSS